MALTFQDNRLLDPRYQTMLLDRAKRMGGTGIQQDVVWGNVFKNGAYDPQAMNALMGLFRAANARGLRPQVRLMGTPMYQARNQPGVDTQLSAFHPNAALAGRFAADMARAFGGQVSKYVPWNEPNVGSFLRPDLNAGQQAAVAPGTYRQIYRAMRAGIKGENRNAKVGLGELTSGTPDAHGRASTVGFFNAILAGKHPLTADFVSVHPYQWSNPGRQPKGMDAGFGGISNLQAMQDAIAAAYKSGRLRTATGHRPALTASEYGYKHSAQPNAATRAQWLRRSMEMFRQAGVHDVNLYQLLPSKQGDSWDSSILGPQGQIPAAFRNLMKR